MKTSLLFRTTVGVLTIIGLATLSWQQHQEITRLRASAVNTNERARLQQRLWAAEKKARDLEARLLVAETPPSASRTNEGSPTESAPRSTATALAKAGPSGPEILAFLNNPETLRALNVKFREQVEARYASLFKTLNLPPTQLAQLKDLLLKRQAATVDVAGAALTQGLKPNTEDLRQLVSGAQADTDRKLAAALGTAGYAQFEAYENAQLFRGATSNLQQGLSRVSAPLSDEQAEQFTTGIATLAQSSFNPAQQQALRQLTQLQQSREALQQVEQLYRDSKNPRSRDTPQK